MGGKNGDGRTDTGRAMNKVICKLLLLILLTFGRPSWSIIATDEWSYANTIAQTVFGILGVMVLSVNFISGRYFYYKVEDEIKEYLIEHLGDLEDANFQRRLRAQYINHFEPVFKSLMEGQTPEEIARGLTPIRRDDEMYFTRPDDTRPGHWLEDARPEDLRPEDLRPANPRPANPDGEEI